MGPFPSSPLFFPFHSHSSFLCPSLPLFPSLSLPLPSFFLPFPFLLLSRTPCLYIQLGGLGERCKLPQWGMGQSPSRNRIWCILELKSGDKDFNDFRENQLTKTIRTIITDQFFRINQTNKQRITATKHWRFITSCGCGSMRWEGVEGCTVHCTSVDGLLSAPLIPLSGLSRVINSLLSYLLFVHFRSSTKRLQSATGSAFGYVC